jgi:hypothetical protein
LNASEQAASRSQTVILNTGRGHRLLPQVFIEKAFNRGECMTTVMLTHQSMFRPGINHDIEGFA